MRTCLLFLAALAASGQSTERRGPVGSSVNFFSLEKETQMGAQLAESVLKKSTPTSHESVRAYVERLGGRIAVAMPGVLHDYHFAVIVEDSPDTYGTHEPAVLPGGYVFVSEHLLLAAQDEAEFAGMLAHAMAHAAARHATRAMTRAEIAQLAWQPMIDLRNASDTRIPISMRQFWREFEREADAIATGVAPTAGFDPDGLARYIARTQVDEKPQALSSMPMRNLRVESIERAVASLPARSYSSSGEFLSIQQQLR